MEAKDFYFQVSKGPDGEDFFYITPKEYYDREGGLSDESGVADEVLPEGFGETMESIYEYEGNSQVGRQILLSLGMKEINFGLDEGEPSVQRDDDEGYFYNGERIEEEEYDELKELLKDNSDEPHPFDYKNVSTDMLIRHKKMMVETEAYEEAAKIQEELNSRQAI
jgi:hypothetical protein